MPEPRPPSLTVSLLAAIKGAMGQQAIAGRTRTYGPAFEEFYVAGQWVAVELLERGVAARYVPDAVDAVWLVGHDFRRRPEVLLDVWRYALAAVGEAEAEARRLADEDAADDAAFRAERN